MQSSRLLASVFIERLTSSKNHLSIIVSKKCDWKGTMSFYGFTEFQYADVYSECVHKIKNKNFTVTFPTFYSRMTLLLILAVLM